MIIFTSQFPFILLFFFSQEAVESNRKLSSLIPEDRLLSIIDCAVKTPIQTSDPHVSEEELNSLR